MRYEKLILKSLRALMYNAGDGISEEAYSNILKELDNAVYPAIHKDTIKRKVRK